MAVAPRAAWSLNVRMTHRPIQRAPWSRWSDERLLTLRFRELRLSATQCMGGALSSSAAAGARGPLAQGTSARVARRRLVLAARHSRIRDSFLPGPPQTHATRACANAFGGRWHARRRAWRSCGTRRRTRSSTRTGCDRRASVARALRRLGHAVSRSLSPAVAAARRFVRHLPGWYAQSHPDEDFAETFAVWLRPGSRWRSRYATWPRRARKAYVH